MSALVHSAQAAAQQVPVERLSEELERVRLVLARQQAETPELSELPPWLRSIVEWFLEFLKWIFEDLAGGILGASGISAGVLWMVAIGVLAALGLLAFFVLRPRLRRRAGGTPRDAVRVRMGELLERARAARAAGDRQLALRLFLWALIVGLAQRGDLAFNPAWTNRELLRRGRPEPRALALLAELIDELEPKEYGRAPIEEPDLDRLAGLAANQFAALAAEGRAESVRRAAAAERPGPGAAGTGAARTSAA